MTTDDARLIAWDFIQDDKASEETRVAIVHILNDQKRVQCQRDALLTASQFVYGCLQQERAWRNIDLNQAMIALSDAIAKAVEEAS